MASFERSFSEDSLAVVHKRGFFFLLPRRGAVVLSGAVVAARRRGTTAGQTFTDQASLISPTYASWSRVRFPPPPSPFSAGPIRIGDCFEYDLNNETTAASRGLRHAQNLSVRSRSESRSSHGIAPVSTRPGY